MVQAYESYYQDRVAGDPNQLDRLAFTLAARRSRLLWRAFSIVNDGAETKSLPRPSKPTRSSAEVGLAFVFTGQGAQYAHMGYDLCRYTVFRQTLEQVDGIYRSLGAEWSLFGKRREATLLTSLAALVDCGLTCENRQAAESREHQQA
jgi:acyl transferase domain-containing protein